MEEKVKEKYTVKRFIDDVLEITESVIFWIFVLRLAFMFIVGIAQVDGRSMVPTLQDGQKLIYYHLFYEPEDGDIVIVDNSGLDKVIVKRVIATEGQTLDIDFNTGTVTVDGTVLSEPYINNLTVNNTGAFEDEQYPLTIPEGHVFVMGDNRQNSTDSRHWQVGFIDKEEIVGKVVMRYNPLSEFRLFF